MARLSIVARCCKLAPMRRYSPLLVILLMVPIACDKQGTTTPPSESSAASDTEPAPVPVADQPAGDAEDAEADDLEDEMTDEELDAMDAELAAEIEAEMGDYWAELEAEGGEAPESGSGFGGRGKKVPNVRQAAATVEGNLDKDIVRRIVRAHINEIRSCYNAGLTRDESLAGKVGIEFTIAADGFVSASKVVDSDLGDAKVGECMAKAVAKWQFPKPTGGGEVRVVYPFLLEPG